MGSNEVMVVLREQGPVCAGVALYHLAADSSRVLCQRWTGPIDDVRRAEVLEQIEERALRQCNVLGGSHAFYVEAYDNARQVLMSEVFRVTAEALVGANALATEPPNDIGQRAQQMRHQEKMHQLYIDAIRAAVAASGDTVQRQQAVIAQYDQDRMAWLTLSRESIHQNQQHELELRKVEANAAKWKGFLEQLQQIAPEVMAMVRHKKIGDVAGAAAIGMRGFLETLKPDQVETIIKVLDGPQQLVLVEAMKRLATADENERKRKEADSAAKIAKH
jgi:hypothetical protein